VATPAGKESSNDESSSDEYRGRSPVRRGRKSSREKKDKKDKKDQKDKKDKKRKAENKKGQSEGGLKKRYS
jgi:hypothetical protein